MAKVDIFVGLSHELLLRLRKFACREDSTRDWEIEDIIEHTLERAQRYQDLTT